MLAERMKNKWEKDKEENKCGISGKNGARGKNCFRAIFHQQEPASAELMRV